MSGFHQHRFSLAGRCLVAQFLAGRESHCQQHYSGEGGREGGSGGDKLLDYFYYSYLN